MTYGAIALGSNSMKYLLWISGLLAFCLAGSTQAENARPAADFVDFLGVNTHLGYNDTPYRDYDRIIKPRLLELGIHHIRDGTFSGDVLRKYLDLGTHGIRVLLIADSSSAVERAKKLGPVLFAIEGVNEPDGRKGDWAPRIRREQRKLYEAIKQDAATRHVPVVVSSLANLRDSPGQLGDLTAFLDFGNMHPYAAGNPPSRHWGWGLSMERAIAEARKVSREKPILVTECGYHNRVANEGHPGVTEAAEAKYLPRLLLVYFHRGMAKAYKYELLDLKPDPEFTDLEKHFGLLRANGAAKPSFVALKNLIRLLADDGPAAKAGRLDFQLRGATGNVVHTLLQKRNGTFWLALFQEAVSYDLKTRRDVDVLPQKVIVKLPWISPGIRVFRPNRTLEPTQSVEKASEVSLEVPDEVVLLEIKPAGHGRAE
jgi:hypothetical protein